MDLEHLQRAVKDVASQDERQRCVFANILSRPMSRTVAYKGVVLDMGLRHPRRLVSLADCYGACGSDLPGFVAVPLAEHSRVCPVLCMNCFVVHVCSKIPSRSDKEIAERRRRDGGAR